MAHAHAADIKDITEKKETIITAFLGSLSGLHLIIFIHSQTKHIYIIRHKPKRKVGLHMNEFPKEKLLNLSDDAFKSLIYEINSQIGGSQSKADKLASDIPSLKKQISKMSPSDAEQLLGHLKKASGQSAEEILKKLNNIK